MAFLGRVHEQEWSLRALTDGAGGLLLGHRGIGKTALLTQIGRRTNSPLVLLQRRERTWPYSAMSAVAVALGGARGAAIDRVVRDAPDAGDPRGRFVVANEISRALHAIDAPAQSLLIDNLHHADEDSTAVLSYLFARLGGTGIGLLATTLPTEDLAPFAEIPRLALLPLLRADALALAAQSLGADAAPGVVDLVATFTGGHPWAITRTEMTARERSGAAPVPLPPRVVLTEGEEHRLDGHLRIVDPDARPLLDMLAVAPYTPREVLLERAGDRPHLVDALIDDGVVDSSDDLLRIADPALRVALYARIDAAERRALHEWSARADYGVDRSLARWHESFRSSSSDDDDALLSLAADHVRSGDIDTAVEFAERSLHGRHGTAARSALLLAFASVLWSYGRVALAEFYLGRVTALDRERLRLESALLHVRIADSAHHVVDDAVVDAYVGDRLDEDPAGCARLLAEVARIRLRRGELDLAAGRIDAAVAFAGESVPLEYRLLQDATVFGGGGGRTLAGGVMESAERAGALSALGVVEMLPVLWYLTYSERYELCRSRAAVFLERSRPPEPAWREQVYFRLAVNEVRAEDPVGAREAVTRWQRARSPEATLDAADHLLLAAAEWLAPRRDDEELSRLIRRGRAACDREHNAALPVAFDALEGRRALVDGRVDDALRLLGRAATSGGDPSLLRAEGDFISALWRSGRRAEAAERSRAFAALVAFAPHPSAWLTRAAERARVQCAGDLDDDSDEVATTAPLPAPQPDGRPALRLVRRASPPPAMERTAAPAPHPVPPRSPAAFLSAAPVDALTPEEREVARLVHLGLRNREIAATLFVSVRTVELRLTRIYRKLDVRSRSHLVAILGVTEVRPAHPPADAAD